MGPRTNDEQQLFQLALSSLHLVFSNPRWFVVRLVHTPAFAENSVLYDRRGWCFFESAVATIGCYQVCTLDDGHDCNNATPVPLLPERFNKILDDQVFATHNYDMDFVKSLYQRVFPTICGKNTRMVMTGWSEVELESFLPVLEKMHKLTELELHRSSILALDDRLKKSIEDCFAGKVGHRFLIKGIITDGTSSLLIRFEQ